METFKIIVTLTIIFSAVLTAIGYAVIGAAHVIKGRANGH